MASERAKRGREMYGAGASMEEISRAQGVTLRTVRGWKAEHGWGRREELAQVCEAEPKGEGAGGEKGIDGSEKAEGGVLAEWEQVFCRHYLRCWNPTAAWMRARPGTSADEAALRGVALLAQPRMLEELERLQLERARALLHAEPELVAQQLRIAFADMGDFVEVERLPAAAVEADPGKPGDKRKATREKEVVRFKGWDNVDGTLVSEVRQTGDSVVVKLADRQRALAWLAKYFRIGEEAGTPEWKR